MRTCPQVIDQALRGSTRRCLGTLTHPFPRPTRVVCTSDYWAWLRIAEGCDNRCAYCIIPMIRGRFRSRPEEAILAGRKTGPGGNEGAHCGGPGHHPVWPGPLWPAHPGTAAAQALRH
ncbi:MAG: hypothetical protein ACLR1T_08170 [Evtepia gabavorous]